MIVLVVIDRWIGVRRVDEGPHLGPVVPENDRQVRNVAPQPGAVPPWRDHVRADDDRRGYPDRLATRSIGGDGLVSRLSQQPEQSLRGWSGAVDRDGARWGSVWGFQRGCDRSEQSVHLLGGIGPCTARGLHLERRAWSSRAQRCQHSLRLRCNVRERAHHAIHAQLQRVRVAPHERYRGIEAKDHVRHHAQARGSPDSVLHSLGCRVSPVPARLTGVSTPGSFSQPPVVAISRRPDAGDRVGEWPRTVPAVAQLLENGLEPSPGVTFLVGENGSGKSTIVEGIALAYGFSPEGGSAYAQHSTRATESALSDWLQLQRGIGSGRWGFFLRAETMHSFYTYLEHHPSNSRRGPEPAFHEMSHGESFLAILETRFDSPGFYCLDEPEAALSFGSTLTLVATLHRIADEGGQVICATHSPVLAALPGARILELGEWGMRDVTWEDLALVQHWRSYLDSPQRYLRHLLG